MRQRSVRIDNNPGRHVHRGKHALARPLIQPAVTQPAALILRSPSPAEALSLNSCLPSMIAPQRIHEQSRSAPRRRARDDHRCDRFEERSSTRCGNCQDQRPSPFAERLLANAHHRCDRDHCVSLKGSFRKLRPSQPTDAKHSAQALASRDA